MVQEDEVLSKKIEKVSSAAVFNRSFHIHKKAIIALQREGFSLEEINKHHPRYLIGAHKDFVEADLIIGMNNFNKYFVPCRFRKKYKSLSEVAIGEYKDVPDPFLMKDINDYFAVMDIIKEYLEKFKENLKKQ